jgi:hypothetical protein
MARLSVALALAGLGSIAGLSQPVRAAQRDPFAQEYRTGHPPRFDRPAAARPSGFTKSTATTTVDGQWAMNVVQLLSIHPV